MRSVWTRQAQWAGEMGPKATTVPSLTYGGGRSRQGNRRLGNKTGSVLPNSCPCFQRRPSVVVAPITGGASLSVWMALSQVPKVPQSSFPCLPIAGHGPVRSHELLLQANRTFSTGLGRTKPSHSGMQRQNTVRAGWFMRQPDHQTKSRPFFSHTDILLSRHAVEEAD